MTLIDLIMMPIYSGLLPDADRYILKHIPSFGSSMRLCEVAALVNGLMRFTCLPDFLFCSLDLERKRGIERKRKCEGDERGGLECLMLSLSMEQDEVEQ